MSQRPFEQREGVLDAADAAPASSWMEAADALLERRELPHREALSGSPLDRSEARKHIRAIEKIRTVLREEKGLTKKRSAWERSNDPLVQRMRRADLLCPKGWREGIRQKLVSLATASEQAYLKSEAFDDQDIIDSIELNAFVAYLDRVEVRGQTARQVYARKMAS